MILSRLSAVVEANPGAPAPLVMTTVLIEARGMFLAWRLAAGRLAGAKLSDANFGLAQLGFLSLRSSIPSPGGLSRPTRLNPGPDR